MRGRGERRARTDDGSGRELLPMPHGRAMIAWGRGAAQANGRGPATAGERVTIQQIQRMKRDGQRIVMMTAYDYELARIVDRAGPEMLLVGDSGARYALGYDQNITVTMDEMVLLTRSVCRARPRALVVADMPFMSYQASVEEAVRNAGRLIKEGGADAVKVEGGEEVAPVVQAIVRAGIPVQGHIGLTPHTAIGVGTYTNPE